MISTRRQSGFSVVETIVSIGLFTGFMLIIMGAFLTLTDAARKSRTTRVALDNVSGVVDYMSRELRLGIYFRCESDGVLDTYDTLTSPRSCPYSTGGGNILGFERFGGNLNLDTDQTVFRLNNGLIERSITGGASYEPLTASDITITSLRFYVEGTDHPTVDPVDPDQPRIGVLIRGIAGGGRPETQTTFTLQATLSARTPNISPP